MLNFKSKNIMTGEFVIDGHIVAGYNAELSSNDPSVLIMNSWINNQELYKEHRLEARAAQAEFEDAVYAIQDEMLAKLAE
jgi:hypothetical protein